MQATEMVPAAVNDWPVDVVRAVLWFFGDPVNGVQPGDFRNRLMLAVSGADRENRARLRIAFPELVGAMDEVQYEVGGLERLIAVSKAARS